MDNLNPQQIQQMIEMLQSMLPNAEQQPENDFKLSKPKKSPKTQKKSAKQSGRINKFDSMSEARMHKEDVEVDRKLIVQPPVPRARKFNLVKATCRVCGKKEDVNPVLITDSIDRYKCNKCSGAAG